MEFIAVILTIIITFVCSYGEYRSGFTNAKASTREEIIIFCNQMPQECKKEFEYYRLKAEVEESRHSEK